MLSIATLPMWCVSSVLAKGFEASARGRAG